MAPDDLPGTGGPLPAIAVPPGVLFLCCLGLGYAADRFLPLKVLPAVGPAKAIAAGVLMLLAFLLGVLCFRAFASSRTPVDVGRPAVRLVDSGPYRFSRNPLYVALLLAFAAFAVVIDSVWMYTLIPALALILHFGVILPEEDYLENRFGRDYLEYAASVRRWL